MEIEDVLAYFKEHENSEKAIFDQKIILDHQKHYGLKMGEIRSLAKKLKNSHFVFPREESYEMNLLCGLTYAYSSYPLKDKFNYFKEYFKTIDNWAIVDSIGVSLSLKEKDYPLVFEFFKEVNDCKEEFLIRFSYILYLSYYVDQKYEKDIFPYIKEKQSYYILMSEAWLLAKFYIIDKINTWKKIKTLSKEGKLLNYTVRKLLDSYQVSKEDKERIKAYYGNQKNRK